jgi:hypothetical protein
MSKELYHTRKTVAKALGLKWGAYHLARAGNPVQQADHFLDFARPEPDDLIALDIEENNPREFLSLEDAEIFARRIYARIGRWPVLYTNGATAKYVADNRQRFPILSRMRLWYARYKPGIAEHFPKGHWQSYTLWQFASQINCTPRACPYRVPGTNRDIDVNVSPLSLAELRRQWPFDGLEPLSDDPSIMMLARVPVPEGRPAPHPSGTNYPRVAATVPVKSYLVPRPATAVVAPTVPAIAAVATAPDPTIQTGSLSKTFVPLAAYPYQAAFAETAIAPSPFAALAGAPRPAGKPAMASRPAAASMLANAVARISSVMPAAGQLLAEHLLDSLADRCSAAMNPFARINAAILSLPLGRQRADGG